MASDKEATEPRTGPSTPQSDSEEIPAEMTFAEFADLLERRPDLRGGETTEITYRGKTFWKKGDGELGAEEVARRVSSILAETEKE